MYAYFLCLYFLCTPIVVKFSKFPNFPVKSSASLSKLPLLAPLILLLFLVYEPIQSHSNHFLQHMSLKLSHYTRQGNILEHMCVIYHQTDFIVTGASMGSK